MINNMKIKLLLSLILLASFKLVNAQWTNEVPSNAWVYNFTNGTARTITSGVTSGATIDDKTTNTSPFLPAPPSGTARVYGLLNTGAAFTLDPVNNTLTHVSSLNTSVSKFSAYNANPASPVVTASFTINFGRVGANAPADKHLYIWSLGTRASSTNIYDNTSGVYTPANSNRSLFNALRFIYSSSTNAYTVAYRASGTTTTTTAESYVTLSGGTLSPDVPYKVEVYCNNSAADQSYTKNSISYTVSSGTYQIWITNTSTNTAVRYYYVVTNNGISTNIYNIPKSVETGTSGDLSIPTDAVLNSFLIQGSSNANNYAKLTLNGGISLSYNGPTTLPVSLNSFNGSLRNNEVALSWQTVSELNNSYFMLLRAGDDKNFQEIAKVDGNGTTNQVSKYNFIDRSPLSGNNYYQLKQVDEDGLATIHEQIVAVKASLNEERFSIIGEGNQSVKVNITADYQANGILVFYNTNGQKVFETSININKGYNQFSYDATSLTSGIYVAKVSAGSLQLSKKFLKN